MKSYFLAGETLSEAAGKKLLLKLRGYFISGLVFLLPFVVTIFVLFQILQVADNIMGPAIKHLIGRRIPGLGIITTVAFIILTGLVAKKAGEGFYNYLASFFMKIPLARWLITITKELSDFLMTKRQMLFRCVLMVEYPRKGVFSIGFEVADAPLELNECTGQDLVSVFIPTTPNPTSGLLVFFPKKEVRKLEMGVDIAMKLVISGGIVTNEV
ncbi:MAG: DUF502 domain-containing protein [Candidatus Wallbacteria bacterium]|nr:DUF502 domain-containing protein [Candidatus Wallbacteria bacterium]